MRHQPNERLRILMADDSSDDVFFVQRALERSRFRDWFGAVSGGEEVISWLRAEGKYSDRDQYPFPTVLLLDLKMPGLGGFEVLEWLASHPECKVIPTIIFSSSAEESDVHRAYVLGANAYMVKPSSTEEMVELIGSMHQFWGRCQTPLSDRTKKCA